jgi:RHS repeat-associated protein
VVRATDSSGTITDRIRYTAYGEPQRYSLLDVGKFGGNIPDGSFDNDDFTAFINSFGIGDASVDPAADVDHDGTIDGSDYTAFMNAFAIGDEGPLGTGQLSRELDAGFRRGYAGSEFDPVLGASSASIYHVRNRVYDAESGRWNRRDPLGYVDGMGLYEYCRSQTVERSDPTGLIGVRCIWPDGSYDNGDNTVSNCIRWANCMADSRRFATDDPGRGIFIEEAVAACRERGWFCCTERQAMNRAIRKLAEYRTHDPRAYQQCLTACVASAMSSWGCTKACEYCAAQFAPGTQVAAECLGAIPEIHKEGWRSKESWRGALRGIFKAWIFTTAGFCGVCIGCEIRAQDSCKNACRSLR